MLDSANTPSHSDADDAQDGDDEGVDLLGSSKRSASNSDNDSNTSSPQKVLNSQSTPPRHTARSLQFPKTPSLSSQASQLSLQDSSLPSAHTSTSAPSQDSSVISNVSNIDLADFVAMSGRLGESRFAARVEVVGDGSSDTTSEMTGSRWNSSEAASSSQTPSIFSTGSAHTHLTPSNFPHPRCRLNHVTDFVQYHTDNHRCDWPGCESSSIPSGAFGWHCPQCSFDICVQCCPIDFTPESSQITIHSSLSQSDSQAAPRLQEDADAAAIRRGQND